MRLLGIDYGEKKIGVAVSDENEKFAFPFVVLENTSTEKVLCALKKIINEEKISKIILGKSLDFENNPNLIMKRIDAFKLSLENKFKIPVEFENETLTSRQASRKMAKAHPSPASFRKRQQLSFDEKVHASAAALILQGYLDKQHNG